MIIVHHLNNSRSQRILWLLEELGLDYEIQHHARDPKTQLAPRALRDIHPLGKAPVVVDDGLVVAESGAIIEHLIERHGPRLKPAAGSPQADAYRYWLHYAEGSAMTPLLLKVIFKEIGKQSPLPARPLLKGLALAMNHQFINPQLRLHVRFWEQTLSSRAWFAGDAFSGADVQMSFALEGAAAAMKPRKFKKYKNVKKMLDRIRARPAYQRALEKGGPFELLER